MSDKEYEKLLSYYEKMIKVRDNEIFVLKQVNLDLHVQLQKFEKKNKKRLLF